MSHRLHLALAACVLLSAGDVAAQVTLPMTSHEQYLRVDPSDTASPPLVVALEAHGFQPGGTLRIEPQGDYDNGPGGDAFKPMMAVFSSSPTLLASDLVARVPGAIDAGIDYLTHTTCPNNLPTDIPEDFTVDEAGVDVQIPAGATHLFLCPRDCYTQDNSDPDGDFGVRLTQIVTGVPTAGPTSFALLPARPTPALTSAVIPFAVPVQGHVRLTLHDLSGRRVATLLDEPVVAGRHEVGWDTRRADGRRAPAGIYFVHLVTAQGERTGKLVLAN